MQFVGCLASRVNNLPLLLFTKSVHEQIFTVVGGEDLQFVGCLASKVNNPPTSSLYKEFA